MDKLVLEPEVEKKIKTENVVQQKTENSTKAELLSDKKTDYLNSLDNMTIADYKKKEEDKRVAEFEAEKEELIQQIYKPAEKEEKQVSQNIIEKPNYDFIEENKKVVKFKQKNSPKKKPSKKFSGIAIACALGISSLICVTNCAIVEAMNSNYLQISETYNLNLLDYLKNINNLDNAQNGMEMIETYPDELLEAGDIGKESNWFDRICNYIVGIFGG